MNKLSAKRVMNGKWGMLYWDGEAIFEVDSFEATLKTDREDIEFVGQMAKDSKLVGYTGEYSFKIKKVFSRGQKKLVESIKSGNDVRSQFIGKIADPDAYGSERLVLEDCWFNDISLMKFESGKMMDEEYKGGFTDCYFPDLVNTN